MKASAPGTLIRNQRTKTAHRALDAFRRIVRQLRLADVSTHSRTGLSGAQLFVLIRIAAAPVHSLNELAERTLTDRTSVAALVRRLATRRLVTRGQQSADRRRSSIRITPAGRALVRRISRAPADLLLAAIAALPASHASRLASALEELVDAMGIAGSPAEPLFDEGSRKSKSARNRPAPSATSRAARDSRKR